MASLLSVNVGMPRDIEWRGRTVHTGIWKEPVHGRRRVGRLNIEGDGQGDLAGHGGEQRAVFVYQIESHRYWKGRLGRRDLAHGQFGENFTVEGLADDEVCIGDRYRIGTALFEVTQPRVTCYRVGIRMDEPQMASLLTSSNRPGFYFRVIEEGDVSAGDSILLVTKGAQRMTVAEVNALLYSSRHSRDLLERVLQISALSPGWRGTFEALLRSQDAHSDATGNAGLLPPGAAQTAAPGFRRLRVAQIDVASADVLSFMLQPTDERRLTAARAGQFVVVRMRPSQDRPPFVRSYSLSGPPSDEQYRISVKVEPDGAAGKYLNGVRAGDVLDVSEPRGSFIVQSGTGPVVLLSAGIGVTPVLAMLHALAASATPREVWWLHGARDRKSHSFVIETKQLLGMLVHGRSRIWYSRPAADDREGMDYDATGHVDAQTLDPLGVPRDADFLHLRPSELSWKPAQGPARVGRARGPSAFRGVCRRSFADAGRDLDCGVASSSARRVSWLRPTGVLCPQRHYGALAHGRAKPTRTGGGVRCARPMVLSHRYLSQLRERPDLRGRDVRAGSTRSTRTWKCVDLLLSTARRRRDRPLSGVAASEAASEIVRGGSRCRDR